ncbi:MAG: hypothetical protein ABSE76_01550 [Minisyncoccia bacterium]
MQGMVVVLVVGVVVEVGGVEDAGVVVVSAVLSSARVLGPTLPTGSRLFAF